MDVIVQPLSIISIFTIVFIITTIIIAYYKKWMMTFSIIAISFVVFIISIIFTDEIIGELAFKPIYLTVERSPQVYTLFTSMFLHSTIDPLHIIFNMFMFILVAPSFENRIGAKKFLIIYILTGICAAISHAVIAPLMTQPFNPYIGLIGASGAISGILGAYAFSYPKDKVFFPVFFIIRMPVLIAGAIFLAIQTGFILMGGDPHIAYLAHVGGFISGIIVAAILIRRRGVGLYEQVPYEKRFINSYAPPKAKKVDFSKLDDLANTPDLKEMLNKIKNENVPQVRDIWIEHFFEKARCPRCSSKLSHFNRSFWCESCGFKSKY
jgi:membrane associated rhomboid family serine protease